MHKNIKNSSKYQTKDIEKAVLNNFEKIDAPADLKIEIPQIEI